MVQKVIQINVNHCKAAQDLAVQRMLEEAAGVLCISEPYPAPARDSWIIDLTGRAAIVGNMSLCKSFKMITQGNGFIAAQVCDEVFFSCYISPNVAAEEYEIFLQDLGDSIEHLRGKPIIVTGDFNAKHSAWGSRKDDNRGGILLEWIAQHGLTVVNSGRTPTCSRATGESIVDITMCSENLGLRINEWRVHEDMESLSDHRYISFILREGQRDRMDNNRKRQRYPKWNLKKMDEDLFRAALIMGTWYERYENMTLESIINKVMKTLTEAANTSMPKSKNGPPGKRQAYWWTQEIGEVRKDCIRARRKLKRAKSSKNATEITQILEDLRGARTRLSNLILCSKRKSWMALIRSIEVDPWGKPYKLVMEKFRTSATPVIETLKKDFLSSVLGYLFPNKQNGFRMVALDGTEDIDEISDLEIRLVLQKMKTGVSPGPDGVTAEIIHRAHNTIQKMLKNAFSKCLNAGIFPKIWKEGRLVLIKKPAKPEEEPSSYRPICVLSEVGKMLERIIALRIDRHLSEIGPDISADQYGFRRKKSTVDAILECKTRIKRIISQGWSAVAVSLDISNAFNTLPWDVINEEIRRKNFPKYIRALIYSYLQDRSISYISSDGELTRRKITCGVPQGSVLGPILWNIAYDRVLSRGSYHGCSMICYADDTLLIARGRNAEEAIRRAEIGSHVVINRIEQMGLSVAVEKTEIVVFVPGRGGITGEVSIAGKTIRSKPCMKYLGILIDDKWSMREHFSYVADKGLKTINRLAQIMPNVGGPGENKRRLYCTVAHSVLLYAAPVWATELTKTKAKKELIKLYNVQKVICSRVIASYKTVARLVVLILARVLPIEMQADILKKVYERKKDLMSPDIKEIQRFQKICTEDAINRWKIKLGKPSLPGRKIRTAILPHLSRWFSKPFRGELVYRSTQLLTGHGCFAVFLYRIGKKETPNCGHCLGCKDDSQHTLQTCPSWEEDRTVLRNYLGEDLGLQTLFGRILESKDKWNAFLHFAEVVMIKKEIKEREEENLRRGITQDNRR